MIENGRKALTVQTKCEFDGYLANVYPRTKEPESFWIHRRRGEDEALLRSSTE